MQRVYEYVKANPGATITTISNALDLDRHTAAKYLEKLESQGSVTWKEHGRSKKYEATNSALLTLLQQNTPLSQELKTLLEAVEGDISLHRNTYDIIYTSKLGAIKAKCYEHYRGLKEPCPQCPANKALETGNPQTTTINNWNGKQRTVQTKPFKNSQDDTIGIIEIIKE